jgi:hypothetical protein
VVRTPARALAWAASTRGSEDYDGLCQKFVRDAYDLGQVFGSAIGAWNGARWRHSGISAAPDGAPVYMSHPRSKYGHVALLRRIGGTAYIETTNSAVGRTCLQALSLWTAGYGYTLLGWTEDVSRVHVCDPLPTTSTTTLQEDIVPLSAADLDLVQARMNSALVSDLIRGREFQAVIRARASEAVTALIPAIAAAVDATVSDEEMLRLIQEQQKRNITLLVPAVVHAILDALPTDVRGVDVAEMEGVAEAAVRETLAQPQNDAQARAAALGAD